MDFVRLLAGDWWGNLVGVARVEVLRRSRMGIREARSARTGAAAAELAIALPILMTILLGCIDFGRFGYYYASLANAARAGASYGAMNPYLPGGGSAWRTAVEEAARDELFSPTDSRRNNMRFQPRPNTYIDNDTGLRYVRVVVGYDFQTVVPWPFIPNTVRLEGAIVMASIR
jgi:hypothetical protein